MANQRNFTRYELKQGHEVVYRGITEREFSERASEHAGEGKRFSHAIAVGPRVTEQTAREWEKHSLETYRSGHSGRNPKYNKDRDG